MKWIKLKQNRNKGVNKTPTASIIFSSERIDAFLSKSVTRQEFTQGKNNTSSQHFTRGCYPCNKERQRNKRHTNYKGSSKTLYRWYRKS